MRCGGQKAGYHARQRFPENWQVERYRRTMVAKLWCYVDKYRQNLDVLGPCLTCAYNAHMCSMTVDRAFSLTLSHEAPRSLKYRGHGRVWASMVPSRLLTERRRWWSACIIFCSLKQKNRGKPGGGKRDGFQAPDQAYSDIWDHWCCVP